MTKRSFLFATTALIPLHLFAQAVPLPQLLNFDGQLINSATNSPINTPVTVDFKIFDGSGTTYCLLYEETQSVTPNSDGEFSVKIGPDTGNASPSTDGDVPWATIFTNNGQVRSADATYCPLGYTPGSGHARRLRVIVGGVTLTPDYTIAPVPMATVAQTLQGKVASDFLLASPPATASNTSVISGNLRLNNNFGLQLTNTGSTNFVTLQAPAALAASYALLLPINDGSSGEVLSTDGNGVLSWIAPSGGGAITSIFGRTGTVVSVSGDYTAGQITSTAVGSLTAVNVQAAIAELESNKISTGSSVISSSMIASSAVTSSHINDGTITGSDLAANTVLDGNLTNVSINKLVSGAGQYLTYAPGGTACAASQTLRWVSPNWVCHTIPDALPSQTSNGGRFLTTNGTTPAWSPNLVESGSNIGIGLSAPGTTLDVAGSVTSRPSGTGSGQTGQIFLRELAASPVGTDTVAIRAPDSIGTSYSLTLPPSAGNNGQVLTSDGTGNLNWITPSNTLTSLSGLTAATATNTLANTNYAQAWNWDTLTTQIALSLGTTSGTTGTLLNLTNSFNSATSTGNVLKVAASGASNAAVPLMLTNAGTGNSLRVNDDGTDTDTTPFVIDAFGNVGIGTTAPGTTLHLQASTAQQKIDSTSLSFPGRLVLSSPKNSVDMPVGDIIFRNNSNASSFAEIKGVTDISGIANGALVFTTGGASPTERMRINSGGQVGIGTSTPSANLHSFGGTSAGPLLYLESTSSGSNPLLFAETVGTQPLVDLRYTTFPPSLLVNPNGVGINTATPTASLDVVGTVKLGTNGSVFSASGVCTVGSATYAANTASPQGCNGIPASTNVAVHCSPSQTVLGYISARASGLNQIEITLGVPATSVTMTCMWMVP